MRGSGPATGWWWRPTSPTAPSSSCRPTSPSSPMSTPSISIISRLSQAVQEAFIAFVENVPFYGFAVMCTDHPIVQRLVGRVVDRRIITYGENPQADVRLVDLDHRRRQVALLGAVPRPRRQGRPRHSTSSNCRCRAATTRSMPPRRSRSRMSSAFRTTRSARRSPISAASSGASPASANGTAPTIIDDYGHHPVEIAAVLKAARESTKGQVIAVVQPHRYTRLQDIVRAVLAPASTTPTP